MRVSNPLSRVRARGGWGQLSLANPLGSHASRRLIPLISWNVKVEAGCFLSTTPAELDNSSVRFRKIGNDATCTSTFGWVRSSRARVKAELHWPASATLTKRCYGRGLIPRHSVSRPHDYNSVTCRTTATPKVRQGFGASAPNFAAPKLLSV